ncbi:MAG TPA: M20/M25/M40 family metallo-hydrolase [Pyrinomonadaceae bacterium]|nr:M20/M25/M40 family metallo-hydrolase [Pyrinomonadaceae bacterium]
MAITTRKGTQSFVLIFIILITNGPLALAQRRAKAPDAVLESNIRAELGFLASDAMQGRGSGTNYERVAAEYIGSMFRQFGLEPGGDTDAAGARSYVQTVDLATQNFNEIVTLPEGAKVEIGGPTETAQSSSTWNAVGFIKGSDPRANEAIMLSAHLDHLGVNDAALGDKIFNGADDDASGCVAVLELARALAAGRRPRRTVYFVCFGSEERGGYGARHFVDHSPVPLDHVVADITFEMLGRPDPKVSANTLWLTGFERSNLGSTLARRGALLVADPHPEQNFFQRSDNYTLALRGVVAHTVSSFNLHSDYHRPSDELSKIDFPFMARSIKSLIIPIRWLANSKFKPSWLPGKAPVRN